MKIKVNANYTYETMPDYTDPVEGAKELVVSGHEISVAYIPDVVYDHKSGVDLHLHILQPKIMLEEDRTFPLCDLYQRLGLDETAAPSRNSTVS